MALAVEEMSRSDAINALRDRTVAKTSDDCGDRYDVWAGKDTVVLTAQEGSDRTEYDDYSQFHWALKGGEWYAPNADRPSVNELVKTIAQSDRGDG